MRIIVLLILLTSISACNQIKKKQQELKSTDDKLTLKEEKDIKNSTVKKHCYIKNIKLEKGEIFIVADYVDFLHGEEAMKKAKENNDLDYEIDKKGDTIYYLDNDYYISNVNPKLRTLKLSPNVKIELWSYPQNNGIHNKVTIQEFVQCYEDNRNPILVLELKDNIVTRIVEQYVP